MTDARPEDTPGGAGLVIRGLSKTFSGQRALDDVSMNFHRGRVTALLGQNGSGKSTLIKVLAGFYSPDPGGEVFLDGSPVELPADPKEVYRRGLRFVHQDLGLVEGLTIADNFAFASKFRSGRFTRRISRRAEHARVRQVFDRLEIDLDPGLEIGRLDSTSKSMLAIARAIQDEPDGARDDGGHVLILDEPTAALPQAEVTRVLDLVRRISSGGGAVVYVSHRIDEVLSVADDVVVLRDGIVTAHESLHNATADHLARMIVGREVASRSRAGRHPAAGPVPAKDPLLELEGVSASRLQDVGLRLAAGEILGIGGLLGCGRSELARVTCGAQAPQRWQATLEGRPYKPRSAADALKHGVVYVPQDRRRDGCIPGMSLQENLTLGTLSDLTRHGVVRFGEERQRAARDVQRFRIVPGDPRRLVANFSGGNQQKIVLAKALRHRPKVIVLDEPMQGIDIGAKEEISHIIRELAGEGVGIIVASTDVEDLTGLCDRVTVLNRGRITGELTGAEITVERILVLSSMDNDGTVSHEIG